MSVSRPETETLRASLERMLGGVESIEPLARGTSGDTFLVRTTAGCYAAKRFARHAAVPCGPAEQFELLSRLEACGISPTPVGVDAGERLLVTRFVADAAALDASALQHPARLDELARALRRLHAADSSGIAAFSAGSYARTYVEAVGEDSLSPQDRRRYEELIRLSLQPLPGEPGLCHNDLLADNILFGATLTLLDFDYATVAAPVLDLASVVVMNDLDAAAATALLEAYFAGPAPFSGSEFARVQRLIRLLAHFWALAFRATRGATDADRLVEVENYRIENG